MNLRLTLGGLCTLLFMMTAGAARAQQAQPRPNILILLCDDLGHGDLGCYGNRTIKTPNLDQFAAEGLRLTACYSASPVCSPSRAGLITGRSPTRLGIHDWIPERAGIFLRPGETTIAQVLKRAGYRTCHLGKWHLNSRADGSETTPGDAGFDSWMYTQNNAWPSHVNPANFVRQNRPVGELQGASSAILADEAIRWLEQKSDRPFFLNVWFHESHEPVAALAQYLGLYPGETNLDRKHYRGDVSQMDEAVGRILRYLDAHGLRQNTFVFFTSDNGPETLNRYRGANRSYGSPGPLRGMKLHITEAGYRVPGIVRWPGHTTPGATSDTPVCSLDLLPTTCALAGVDPPHDRPLDGANFLPLLENQPIKRPHPLYWEYSRAISKPWVISLREGPWKLLATARLERFQLYHVSDDPAETHNLAAEQPDRVQAMAAIARKLHAEMAADAARSGNPAP